jgi:hypothetical protein
MKKKNESGAENSASTRGKQPQKIHGNETRSGVLPPAVPDFVREKPSAEEMSRMMRARRESQIIPTLYLWAAIDISDKECLTLLCRAICENEKALCAWVCSPLAKSRSIGESLALVRVAKGLNVSPVFPSINRMMFKSLPGLLGKSEPEPRYLLEEMAGFLYAARSEIKDVVIGRIKDRNKALELAEALVIAEAVCERGETVETDKDEQGMCVTPSERLASNLLDEVMMAGGAK